jgi:hypothetical protein
MAFIVEDGTGVTGATSYVSIAEADAYAEDVIDNEWLDLDDDEKQRRLIVSSQFLDRRYGKDWLGFKLKSTQGRDWPRYSNADTFTINYLFNRYNFIVTGLVDSDGFSLENQVPIKLKYAVIELSRGMSLTTISLYPSVDGASNIKNETTKVGPVTISQEFFENAKSEAARSVSAEIEDLVAELIIPQSNSHSVVRF